MKRVTLILAAAVIRVLGLLASTRGEYKEESSRGRKAGREGREKERSSVRCTLYEDENVLRSISSGIEMMGFLLICKMVF